MATKKHTVDRVTRIWDDSTGDRLEIGDDGDGLDLTELRWVGRDGKTTSALTITDDILPHVIAALQERKHRHEPGTPA